MQVVLNEPFEISDDGGKPIISLGANAVITPIHVSYLPRNVHIENVTPLRSDTIEDVCEQYYIFYMKGMFLAVEKKDCYVPVAIGWKRNF